MDKWDWEQLYNPYAFSWEYGITPFSNIQLIGGAVVIYLLTIFSLQWWMKKRNPLEMKSITQIHNIILCLWSLSMFLGIAYGSYQKAKADGAYSLLCDQNFGGMKGTYWYWSYSYYLSKYYELFDTVILVLKKKPLSILHVFHHSIMVFMSWTWIVGEVPLQWWGIFTNTLIHVFMYYYYFVATKNQHPWWKSYLTSGQILQFFSVLILIFVHLFVDMKFGPCSGSKQVLLFSQAVNIAFLALFINFYIQTYKLKKKKN